MERRENAPPPFFFTPYALPVRIIVDLAFSLPCWCARLDRCCVELYEGECFGDAITFFIGHYDVAHGELGQSTTPNTPIKIPYNEIRHNAHPISSTTSKQPTPASPLELENLFMG